MTVTFEGDELDAVIAGLALLERQVDEDAEIADFASAAIERINASIQDEPLGSIPKAKNCDTPHHGPIREAIHTETKLRLRYVDKKGRESDRTIWPIELGFVGAGETVAAWCETRQDFRHFRLDRIVALAAMGARYPSRKRILLARLRIDEMEQGF